MQAKTNFIVSIVRILETPKKITLKNNILLTRFRGELPNLKNRVIVNLFVWGNLSNEIEEYYKMDDYIIIEGYLSLSNSKTFKKIQINVLKLYPFVLNHKTDRQQS